MSISFEFINGLCFGIEAIGKDEDVPESAIIIHLAFIRFLFWLGD